MGNPDTLGELPPLTNMTAFPDIEDRGPIDEADTDRAIMAAAASTQTSPVVQQAIDNGKSFAWDLD
jgi:hypothetical protein